MRKHPILSGIGLLVVIIVIGAAASKGSKPTGPTESPALVTTTSSTVAPAAKTHAPAAPQTFKGAGSENIGTISVTEASTLHWSCGSCQVFGVNAISTDDSNTITVDAQNRTSGVTAVEPGTYKSVSVIADEGEGSSGWTITVTPGQ